MSGQAALRAFGALTGMNALLTGTVYYNTNTKLERNYEEMEARMDEVEGTLRGHIGLIEDSLKRIEDVLAGKAAEGGWGKGMSKSAEEMYTKRGKDDRGK